VAIDQTWRAVGELLHGWQFLHRSMCSRRHFDCNGRLEMNMRPFAEKCVTVVK